MSKRRGEHVNWYDTPMEERYLRAGGILSYVLAPMVIAGIGSILSIIGIYLVRCREGATNKQLLRALGVGPGEIGLSSEQAGSSEASYDKDDGHWRSVVAVARLDRQLDSFQERTNTAHARPIDGRPPDSLADPLLSRWMIGHVLPNAELTYFC